MTEKTQSTIAVPAGKVAQGAERPPVVAVLGHIDHGKSTLLDYIRKSNTTEKEAGGITQHISAYEILYKAKDGGEKKITFIDTPGHEAFQSLRKLVAEVADVAILVVSAEDGVKEQTLESLKVVRESSVPFVIAINKTDKPGANIEKTISDLTEQEIYLEGRGGDVPFSEVSAKTGDGVPELIELVLLVSELNELTGNPSLDAEGVVIEANVDPKKGTTGTLIIKNGTIKKGMCVVSGKAMAPVRIMEDYKGQVIDEASFSSPVKIIGFNSLPKIGEAFQTFHSKSDAESCVRENAEEEKGKEGLTEPEEGEDKAIIPIVIKADVSGSINAIEHELKKLESENAVIKIVKTGVGDIAESDIKAIGVNQNALVVGFNVSAGPGTKELAERSSTALAVFSIIYDLSKWLESEIKKRTPKIVVEQTKGRAKILKTFSSVKDKQVIGGRVLEGAIGVGDRVSVKRRDSEIGSGKILELQVQKNPAKEVSEDMEFGVRIESRAEIAVGDTIESTRSLEK